MDEKPLSRFLRYPVCTVISFCLVFALCLECFLYTFPDRAVQSPAGQAASTRSPGDADALLDLPDFRFLLNNGDACAAVAPVVLVLVSSVAANKSRRDAIRETWAAGAKSSPVFKVLFLLGEPDSPEAQQGLELENAEHRDLVQGAFLDVPRNATYKHVMALKWTVYHCPKTRVLFKLDDQTFLNLQTILEFFSQDLPTFWTKRLILCNLSTKLQVERDPSAEDYVPESSYPETSYPAHCRRETIAYTPDVVSALYAEAQKASYFRLDNVLLTGTLARRVNATLVPFGPLALEPHQVAGMIRSAEGPLDPKPYAWPFWTGSSGMSPEEVYQFWNSSQVSGKSGRPLEYMHMGLCPYP